MISSISNMHTTRLSHHITSWTSYIKFQSCTDCLPYEQLSACSHQCCQQNVRQTAAQLPLKPRRQIKAHRDTCSWSFAKPRCTSLSWSRTAQFRGLAAVLATLIATYAAIRFCVTRRVWVRRMVTCISHHITCTSHANHTQQACTGWLPYEQLSAYSHSYCYKILCN